MGVAIRANRLGLKVSACPRPTVNRMAASTSTANVPTIPRTSSAATRTIVPRMETEAPVRGVALIRPFEGCVLVRLVSPAALARVEEGHILGMLFLEKREFYAKSRVSYKREGFRGEVYRWAWEKKTKSRLGGIWLQK